MFAPSSRCVTTLEWTGCFTGLLGAALVSTHTTWSAFGWIGFLLANIALISFALCIRRYGLLVQQLGFMVTSMVGIQRSGLLDRISGF